MKSKTNIVKRICLNCKHVGNQDKDFSYLGNSVWSCNNCLCKYTEVNSVIEQSVKDSNKRGYKV